jgi:hypothetical protein
MAKRFLIKSAKHGNHFVIVDDDDFDLVSKYKWHLQRGETHNTYYVYMNNIYNKHPDFHQKCIPIHRLILGVNDRRLDVDHIDQNGLNNQRSNIRISTRTQNQRNRRLQKNNTSGYKGVSWRSDRRRWKANIKFEGKLLHLGLFTCPQAAARAYNNAAIKYFGDFAKLNNI